MAALAPVSVPQDCEDALDCAQAAAETMAATLGFEHAALLRRAADNVSARAEDIARAMSLESGKALRDSLGETRGAAETLRMLKPSPKAPLCFHKFIEAAVDG